MTPDKTMVKTSIAEGSTSVKPIQRRKKEQQILPDIRQERRDPADNQPIVGPDDEPIYDIVPQAQPPPTFRMVTEDYTQEESSYLVRRLKQQTGEPADLWITRMLDEGAAQVKIDVGDGMSFAGLSTDAGINANYRGEVCALKNDKSLFDVYAEAVRLQYPGPTDWPPLIGNWVTLKECVQRLTRLCIRDAVTVGYGTEYLGVMVPKAVRDQLIRSSPPHYRSAMLAVIMGAADVSTSEMRALILELGSLGDWSAERAEPRGERRDREFVNKPMSRGPRRDERGGSQGPPRVAYWKALLQSGVSPREIDGLPTAVES